MDLAPSVSKVLRVWVSCLAFAALAGMFSLANGQTPAPKASSHAASKTAGSAPTVAEAERFIAKAETRLLDLWIKSGRASWVSENFITDDTEAISADADEAVKAATARLADQAKRYEKLQL